MQAFDIQGLGFSKVDTSPQEGFGARAISRAWNSSLGFTGFRTQNVGFGIGAK